jgi:hypothetical protein
LNSNVVECSRISSTDGTAMNTVYATPMSAKRARDSGCNYVCTRVCGRHVPSRCTTCRRRRAGHGRRELR